MTEFCFRETYGEAEPNNLEEALVATCTSTNSYEQLMKRQAMMACVQSSDELVWTILQQSVQHWVN